MEKVAQEQEEKRKVDAQWEAYHQCQAVPSNEKARYREAQPATASQMKQIERLARAVLTVMISWWLQHFSATRNFIVRAFHGLVVLVIVYGSVGGVPIIIHSYLVCSPSAFMRQISKFA